MHKCRNVYQEYAEAMSKLSLRIMELLGMSLGINSSHFVEFFEDNDSLLRLNYYPRCKQPNDVLGSGPHCDPTSLTILQQDYSGLQVFVDNQWQSIPYNPQALVVNIGDTFRVTFPLHSLNTNNTTSLHNYFFGRLNQCNKFKHFLSFLSVLGGIWL